MSEGQKRSIACSHLSSWFNTIRRRRTFSRISNSRKTRWPGSALSETFSHADPLSWRTKLMPAGSALEGLVSSSLSVCEETLSAESTPACSSNRHQEAEVLSSRTDRKTKGSIPAVPTFSRREPGQIVQCPATVSARSAPQTSLREKGQRLTIERAVQE